MLRSPEMLEPDSCPRFRADPITTGVTTGVRAGRLGGSDRASGATTTVP